jgi:hypothetical protein
VLRSRTARTSAASRMLMAALAGPAAAHAAGALGGCMTAAGAGGCAPVPWHVLLCLCRSSWLCWLGCSSTGT